MARITCLSSMKKNGAYHIAVKVDHRLFNIRCQLLHPWVCPMSQAFWKSDIARGLPICA